MPLPTLKLLIFGTRRFASYTIVPRAIEFWMKERRRIQLPSWPTEVVHGDARGVDKAADWWALGQEIPRKAFRPDYTRYPKKVAPLHRNDLMVDYCDAGLAIWDGMSTGTKYTIDRMRSMKKHLVVVIATPTPYGPVLALQDAA